MQKGDSLYFIAVMPNKDLAETFEAEVIRNEIVNVEPGAIVLADMIDGATKKRKSSRTAPVEAVVWWDDKEVKAGYGHEGQWFYGPDRDALVVHAEKSLAASAAKAEASAAKFKAMLAAVRGLE